jgi:hypothetical protein
MILTQTHIQLPACSSLQHQQQQKMVDLVVTL